MTETRGGLAVSTQQAAVIDHVQNARVTVVSAGAGSGKTRTTVGAVLQLVQDRAADLHHFILITFTNQAADELRERLGAAVSDLVKRHADDPERKEFWQRQQESLAACYIGTIHSFCLSLLRTFGYEERVARESDITFARHLMLQCFRDTLEDSFADPALEPALKLFEYEDHRLVRLAEGILEYTRNHGYTAETVAEWTSTQDEDQRKPVRMALAAFVRAAASRFERAKSEAQSLDSHDLLQRTAKMLEVSDNYRLLQHLRQRYRYLFIDEFQDTDRIQKRIVDAMRPALAGILVVGDRKQSIFGFRSADVSLLEDIARENSVDLLPLSISRRPTRDLLQVQNELFQSIAAVYPALNEPLDESQDVLRAPMTGAPVPFTYVRTAREVAATASQIMALMGLRITDPKTRRERHIEPGDIAVLVRSNRLLAQYEQGLNEALRSSGVQVRRVAGGSFFQRPEVVATYRMLRLLLDHPDETALMLALETPYLREVNAENRLREIISDGSGWGRPLTTWLDDTYPEVSRLLRGLRSQALTDTVAELLARLYESFGVMAHYSAKGDVQAVENLEQLREHARALFRDEQALTLRDFARYLEMAILSGREEAEASRDTGLVEGRPPYVRLMTIHRAKGLEFPIVLIPEVQAPLSRTDLEPDFLVVPGWGLDLKDAKSPRFEEELRRSRKEQLEEEMRILYVAITRACSALVIIGNDTERVNGPDSTCYSWRDEILRARPRLEQVGARFIDA